MKTFSLLAMVTIAALSSSTRLAAQCRPQFNISVYSDGDASTDGSMIYGYSSTDDSSTLCTCVHYNYQTAAYVELANGSYASNTESGETSSVSSATDGDGSYYAFGVAGLTCSCAGNIGGGGAFSAINPPAPVINVNGIVDYVTGSTTVYPGVSSYFEIFGTALTAWGETPTPTVTGDSDVIINSVSYASDGQVNVSYTVAANPTTMGIHNISLTTTRGTATGTISLACATPTNFAIGTQPGDQAYGDPSGALHVLYRFSSSTGRLSDLAACAVGEYVTYPYGMLGTPGSPIQYIPPEPPFPNVYFNNPTVGNEVPGPLGFIADTHSTPGTWPNPLSPLGTTSFPALQYYYGRCPCQNYGLQLQIYPPSLGTLTIQRSVNVTSPTSGVATITKTGVTAIPPATLNVP